MVADLESGSSAPLAPAEAALARFRSFTIHIVEIGIPQCQVAFW
jgi:hypothetical protein